jgi:hypothetical protein
MTSQLHLASRGGSVARGKAEPVNNNALPDLESGAPPHHGRWWNRMPHSPLTRWLLAALFGALIGGSVRSVGDGLATLIGAAVAVIVGSLWTVRDRQTRQSLDQ